MSISKAFILGAGLGTRLKPLTNVLPKPLVPVWNEPLVNHVLRHCQKAGISNFAINTHHIPDAWDKEFENRSFEGSTISLFHEPVLLETGGGIKNIASFIGQDPVLIFNGDIISDIDLKGLIKAHSESDNIATLAVKSNGPNKNVAIKDSQVIDIRNELGIHPGNSQFTGVYCIQPEILELIPANKKISIIPAFLELTKTEKLGSFNVDSASWHDIGTIDSYREIHSQAPDTSKDASFISAKAAIGENCSIENSIIWPNATVEAGSKLKNCIVCSSDPVSGMHEDAIL